MASPEQMQILHELKSGEKTATNIVYACKMHRAAATKMLAKLVNMKLIVSRRATGDKRLKVFAITPKGRQVIEKAIKEATRLGWDFEEVGQQWIEDRARAAKSRNRFMMFADFTTN